MLSSDPRYGNYLKILQEELVPATGCTEPIAIAYGAAKARELLGVLPESVLVEASGNIIKNVKSVVVPNTNSLKGIEAAARGRHRRRPMPTEFWRSSARLPMPTQARRNSRLSGRLTPSSSNLPKATKSLTSMITLWRRKRITVQAPHFGLPHAYRLYREKRRSAVSERRGAIRQRAATCLTDQLLPVRRRGARLRLHLQFGRRPGTDRAARSTYNYAIAEEGMRHSWGANIGSVLKEHYGVGIYSRARYMAAAGSDARMSGCEMPVIIVSGSGNQGITASVPVVEYAKELNVSRDADGAAPCSFRPADHPSQNRHRPAERLLRRCQRGMQRRRRHCLSPRRRIPRKSRIRLSIRWPLSRA